MSLPAKYILLLSAGIAVCVLCIAGLFFLYTGGTASSRGPEESTAELDVMSSRFSQATAELDTDEDGLFDWEEGLWGSDIHVRDTDADGTEDGAEVRAGRDPSVAGPNDQVESFDISATGPDGVATYATTAIATLGKELFGSYLSMKRNGPVTPELQQKVLAQAVSTTLATIKPPTYTLEDLTVSDDTSPEAVARYRAQLLQARSIQTPDNDLMLIHTILTTNDPRAKAQLDSTIAMYHGFIATLRGMPVPTSLAVMHLTALNGIAATTFDFEALGNVRTDSVLALAGSSRLTADITAASAALAALDEEISLTPGA